MYVKFKDKLEVIFMQVNSISPQVSSKVTNSNSAIQKASHNVNFRGEADTFDSNSNKNVSKGYKLSVGILSTLMPGAGQFMNGQKEKGWNFLFMGGSIGLASLVFSKAHPAIRFALGLGYCMAGVFSGRDAYKNAGLKSKEQIINQEEPIAQEEEIEE